MPKETAKKPTAAQAHEILRAPDAELLPADRRREHHLEEAIRKAEADGQFAHLPGRGKPLAFRPEEGMATLSEDWLSNHMLKNADYVPPWAELGRALEAARARSAAAVDGWRGAGTGLERERWAAAVQAAWEAENAAIRKWNAQIPDPTLQRYAMPVERRWRKLQDEQAPGR